MVELKGSLEGIGLPAIVHLVSEVHHSGTLELTAADTTGLLAFEDGRLVAAVIDDLRGLPALRDMTQRLPNANFRVVEGRPGGERSLDLSGADLQRQLARFAAGDDPAAQDDAAGVEQTAPPETCPRLGLADDPTRNRTRPTALHRCYATIAPSLVTMEEQRELCLSGRYAFCPRFRNASRTRRMPNGPSRVERTMPPPGPAAEVSREPLPEAAPRPALVGRDAPREVIAAGPGRTPLSRRIPGAVLVDDASGAARPRPIMIATLAVGALAVLAGGAYVLSRTTATAPGVFAPTPAVQAFEPVPTRAALASALASASPSATVAVAGASATPLPTLAPAPVPAASPAAGQPGRTLLDVRFTTGAPSEWTQNPPYAQWADGAYRLRALQAARFVAVGAPLLNPPSDVLVSATFRKTGGPPGGGYGIVLRESAPVSLDGVNQTFSGYVLETSDMGEFGIWRRDGDRWNDLVPWTRSAAVRLSGSPNDLTARIQGQALSFVVNGVEVANIRESSLRGGGIGVFVGGDFNEVALDHLAVQALTP